MSVIEYSFFAADEELPKVFFDLRQRIFSSSNFKLPSHNEEKKKQGLHIIFSVGNVPAGCGSLYALQSGVWELSYLGLLPEFCGVGHGKLLAEKLLSKARDAGAEKVTALFPTDLLRFASKLGFAPAGIALKKDNADFVPTERSFVFGNGKWLEFGNATEAILAKRTFSVDDPSNVTLTVTGLGFSEIYLNGIPLSDRKLAPAWTNYVPHDLTQMHLPIFDKMTSRILYEEFDLSGLLQKGENTLVFHLGGGWFCQHESRNEGITPYGKLCLCFLIKQNGKAILWSDSAVQYHPSFVTRANIYFGETQDLRIGGYDPSTISEDGWKSADETAFPLTLFSKQDCPPDRVIRHIKPHLLKQFGDFKLYDLGESVAGYAVMRFSDDARIDDRCVVRYGDELSGDGSINFHYSGGTARMQRDEFVFDGKAPEVFPRFTWHGTRYFDVTGKAESVDFCVVHTVLPQKVHFRSSDSTLQWIFDAYIRTQQNNVHCCVPSDCPHRERLGYTGDGQLTSRAVMTCFDAKGLYRKWMRDIADCQDLFIGHVQHTAPYYGGGGGPGGWGGAIVFVPYNYYAFYGEKDVLEAYYPNMLAYLRYLRAHSEDGLVTSEAPGGWCLGDWCSPKNANLIPEPFVNTWFHLKMLKDVIEIAGILGQNPSALQARFDEVKESFLRHYYDEATGSFCGSVEAADAYAFDLGFGDERTFCKITEKYTKLGEFDTGIFGTDILLRVLCENGRSDLAKNLLTSEKENTFFNMKAHGATTLWENWEGCDSRFHPMFGAVVEYLVKYFNEA